MDGTANPHRTLAMQEMRKSGLNNTEIGLRLGVSRERVRQILGNGALDAVTLARATDIQDIIAHEHPISFRDLNDKLDVRLKRLGIKTAAYSSHGVLSHNGFSRKALFVALGRLGMSYKGLALVLRANRFWASVDKRGPEDCWPYLGCTGPGGYGGSRITSRRAYSHNDAWILSNGPKPRRAWVLHWCGNPVCCNPAHLYLGNARQNSRDRSRHGRSGKGRAFTDAEADEIRTLASSGRSILSIWRQFGKSTYPVVYRIVRGLSYR